MSTTDLIPDEAAAPPAPPPVPTALAEETGYLLRRAYVYANEWLGAAMPAEVPSRHYEILQALSDLGPRSQQQLAELLEVNRTIMVKLIDALEAAGLVERHRDPNDRRSYALELTKSGGAAVTDLGAAADRAEAGLTEPLSRDEVAALRRQLTALAHSKQPPPELPAGLAGRVVFLLAAAHYAERERINERLRELEMTTALYGTLGTIAARAPTSQQAIADELGLSGPAVLQNVDRLEKLGLVERRRNPANRRAYALEPTERGREVLGQVRATIEQMHAHVDTTLGGAARRRELNRALRKLLDRA
jgi:DNA-binding MarR family transcriptional regulator